VRSKARDKWMSSEPKRLSLMASFAVRKIIAAKGALIVVTTLATLCLR
jgi:hypothetical protein